MWMREVRVVGDEPKPGMGQHNRADANICNRIRSVGGGSLFSTSFFLLARSKQGMEFVLSMLSISVGYDAGRVRALRRANSSRPSDTHARRNHGVSGCVADGSGMLCCNVLSVGSIDSAWNAENGKTYKSNLSIPGVC
jgi:hypothetical protein